MSGGDAHMCLQVHIQSLPIRGARPQAATFPRIARSMQTFMCCDMTVSEIPSQVLTQRAKLRQAVAATIASKKPNNLIIGTLEPAGLRPGSPNLAGKNRLIRPKREELSERMHTTRIEFGLSRVGTRVGTEKA
jgi:hypothetical protein